MKIKFIIIALSIIGCTYSAYAQPASATATATATIVTPISITNLANMNFGNVAVQTLTGGTVVLLPDGNRSATSGVTLPATPGTVTAASFRVDGQEDYTYAIILPSTAVTLTNGGATMTADVFTSDPTIGAGLLTGGTETLNIGATLHVGAAQATGEYVSGTPFNVIVNYN